MCKVHRLAPIKDMLRTDEHCILITYRVESKRKCHASDFIVIVFPMSRKVCLVKLFLIFCAEEIVMIKGETEAGLHSSLIKFWLCASVLFLNPILGLLGTTFLIYTCGKSICRSNRYGLNIFYK